MVYWNTTFHFITYYYYNNNNFLARLRGDGRVCLAHQLQPPPAFGN